MTRALPITARQVTRIRASESAIKAALNALRDTGHQVQGVWITGAQVEIRCGDVDAGTPDRKDEDLEKW